MKINNCFIINVFRDICHLFVWWAHSFCKRDSRTWLFNSWVGTSYSDSSKRMYEYVLAHHPEINAVWLTKKEQIYNQLEKANKPVIMMGTKEAKQICSKAGYVFISQSAFEMEHLYINGAKQVWLWHGMPLKKIGRHLNPNYDIKQRIHRLFPQNTPDKPDYFISISHKWDDILKQAYPSKNVIITGLPRNDVFFDTIQEPFINDLNERFRNPLKILYLPTFRDDCSENGVSFDPFGMFGFSFGTFNDFLTESNIVFLYKGHYRDIVRNTLNMSQSDRFIKLEESMYSDLYSLIKGIDILMTDYSSVYFDFLLLNKPVILAPFDLEDYYKKSRTFYFDYDEIEGIRAKDWNDVIDIIKHKRYYIPSKKTINLFHDHIDGNSSKRVTDYILNLP